MTECKSKETPKGIKFGKFTNRSRAAGDYLPVDILFYICSKAFLIHVRGVES